MQFEEDLKNKMTSLEFHPYHVKRHHRAHTVTRDHSTSVLAADGGVRAGSYVVWCLLTPYLRQDG